MIFTQKNLVNHFVKQQAPQQFTVAICVDIWYIHVYVLLNIFKLGRFLLIISTRSNKFQQWDGLRADPRKCEGAP